MKTLTFAKLSQLIMQQAKEKGFGTTPDGIKIPEKIALIQKFLRLLKPTDIKI